MELWELSARERIRDTLAAYNWSGDALRLPELAETFCEDGALELRGSDPIRGRAGIVAFLGGAVAAPNATAHASGARRIVRHNVTNIRFTEVTPEQARVACYFTVVTEIGLDHYGRYRDVFVPVGDDWLIRHRFVSTDWNAPDSTMATASAHRQ
ncbi:nuclear transport factor 2 family protein [Mycobacterium deserti]|uniref:Nuclear transport factor 2 family protein n=1 Tax=Mycobacterium deserti TaxID=2978347 RepID=A0ABT2M8Z2_9MYCO|nr:nuclear transport factor 2 family protein [Mycobacterium deserti]MCT7657615.1 nuclear transport factor 2 family protein [Mycobacterium deserti]